jgi:hypothetical protein
MQILLVVMLFYILQNENISVARDAYIVSFNTTQFEAPLLLHSSVIYRCTQNFFWVVVGELTCRLYKIYIWF